MDRASLDRLARFFGRERLGHLYLKAWRFLVDGMSRRLALPDYVGERILDHALSELDSRLDEFRLAIDARPSVWLFALGWSHAEEILKGRTGDTADAGPDAAFWSRVRRSQLGDDGLATSRALVTALGEMSDERHQILLCLDAVARGPANRQIASEATGEGLLVVDELRRDARDALRRAFAVHAPAEIERSRATSTNDRPEYDDDAYDPLAEALRAGLVDEDVFPPLGDIESLYGWLDRHFERSRAEIALAALWKRLPPPEKVEVEEKMAPGPMVALAESLYERIEKLETGIAERLDALDERRDEPDPHTETERSYAGDSGTRNGTGGGASYETGDVERHDSDARYAACHDSRRLRAEAADTGEPTPNVADSHLAPNDGLVTDPVSPPSPPPFDDAANPGAPGDLDAPTDEAIDARVASAHARAGWRTDRPGTPASDAGATLDANGPAPRDTSTTPSDSNGHADAAFHESTNGNERSRRSRFTGFWKAIRPAPREKTHEEVVQRLEKYLPAGKRVRPAPPGSRLDDDPARADLASSRDGAAPADDTRADADA